MTSMNGTYGRAATGLINDNSFAVSEGAARMGARGETRTAEILDASSRKAAIMHDLRVPIPGFKANIDHIVVSGKRVLVLDTKVWKPGFYWTLFGVNRRGLQRVDHTAKNQGYITRALESHLAGTGARITSPQLVVWPSSTRSKLSLWALTVPGANVSPAHTLKTILRQFITRKPADPIIVHRLSSLLIQPIATVSEKHLQLDDADPFAA